MANGLYEGQFIQFGGIPIQAFAEIGTRATLGSPASTLTVSSLPNKKWIMLLIYSAGLGSASNIRLRFNSDSGSNYAIRGSGNGNADATAISQTSAQIGQISAGTTTPDFFVVFI